MNFLYNLDKSLHCGLQKQIRSFWSVRNVFVNRKRNLSDTSVDIKPIVFRPIGVRRLFNKKLFSFTPVTRAYEKSVFDVDTNVKKDVLLYEKKSAFFFVLNYIIPVQLAGWLLMCYQFFQVVATIPPEHLKLYDLIDLNDARWKYGIGFTFAFTGSIISFGAFVFARKHVSKIILHKGGKSVYIETDGLFGCQKKDVVPLDKLSCQVSRVASKGYIALKRLDKGFFYNYVIDNSGHYPDPFLFDMTAGMQRQFKK